MNKTASGISRQTDIIVERVIRDEFCGPCAVTADAEGAFIVAEEFSHCIRKYSPAWDMLWKRGSKGNAPGEFVYPTGVTTDGKKRIYVTNRWNHRVDVLEPDGAFAFSWGRLGAKPEEMNEPWGICRSGEETLLVVDRGNARVLVYTTEGQLKQIFGKGGISPHFYESEQFKRNYHYQRWLKRVERLQTVETFFHAFDFDVGQFEYPEQIACTAEGYCHVTDRVSGHVTVFDSAGTYVRTESRLLQDYMVPSPFSITAGDTGIVIGDERNQMITVKRDSETCVIDLKKYSIKPTALCYSSSEKNLVIADAWQDAVFICRFEGEVTI